MTTQCATAVATAVAVASLSVADLLRRACDGDRAAWEEIMRRFHRLVMREVRSFRLQDADVHDAVQMTWLRLAENCHRIQFPEHLGAWLATVAGRECLRIVRASKHTPEENSTAVENVADPSVGPEQHVINMDIAHTLHDLVAELAPRRRHLLRVLFVDEPPSYVEVSRITGISPGSIGPTRARALRQLRQKLDDNQLRQAVR
ncbi:MAG: RNA polymerase sigma factor [Pseudonocardiaceae bacterium]